PPRSPLSPYTTLFRSEDDQAVGGLPHRGGRVGGDGGGAGAPPQPAEQFQHFGGGAGPGEGDDPVVGAGVGELRGGEGVRLPLPRSEEHTSELQSRENL